MRNRTIIYLSFACMILVSPLVFGGEIKADEAIEPRAGKVLEKMCAYIGSAKNFTFHAEITEDTVLSSGQKLQFARAADVSVRRPNRFQASVNGDEIGQALYYDGKSITLFEKDKNFYGTIDAPPNIDAALDHAIESFSLTAPLSDLLYTNACEIFTENVISGSYVGLHNVHGVKCHHLAFTQDDIDWQVWIEEGKTPFPRKVIITEKRLAGAPQFTALLSKWNVNPELPDSLFIFEVPEGAEKIEFLPTGKIGTP